MSTHFEHDSGDLPIEVEQLIDRLCDQFESELRRGKVPRVQDYLSAIPAPGRHRIQRELVELVREYQQQSGAAARIDSSRNGSTREDVSSDAPTEWNVAAAIAAEFQQDLLRGKSVRVEQVVDQAESRIREELLASLLDIEMSSRAAAGETPDLDEFRHRFPTHGKLVKSLYFEHFVPRSIGGFHVKKLLGSGTFGKVYLASDPRLQREVAIKVFRHAAARPSIGSLLVEARAAASLRHEGIVTVHAIQEDQDGFEFLVLDYVHGSTLEEILSAKSFSPAEAVRLTVGIAEAVQHAHQNGVVHRDLKPANIIVDLEGRPRLTDFGLALRPADSREASEVVGTISYMAPEQIRGETHLVDARTDIWAIGVILYKLLSNRMPFAGERRKEQFAAICNRPPAGLSSGVPLEASRIVSRCLEKRMTDRYQSAQELIADLNAFLRQPGPTLETGELRTPAIATKGLCPFDMHDRDNFLHLVPGPRDRFGIPERVRFWERRLGARGACANFRVGLLYGPSGSGKSSLLRAGILPRLPAEVASVLIEAAPEGTEDRLLRELRRQFPELGGELSLAATIAALRERHLRNGSKIVIAIDQLEQWLHTWRGGDHCPLIEALRQCDGERVQAILLIRDDFWMSARRLFEAIDHELSEGRNVAAVDLFDRDHAMMVLTAFGKAAGRLTVDAELTEVEREFLGRALDSLSENGRIVPVRLCVFAAMIKDRDWNPATLDAIDSQGGLGVTFLNETFEGASASPAHRSLAAAARRVLERFVPASSSVIRGHSVSTEDLLAASGLSDPAELQRLLYNLDRELHILTPVGMTNNRQAAAGEELQHYQLTHDYLVPAIREWLQLDRRRSARGRAELRLVEYAHLYELRPTSRHLPSTWEWLTILGLTRSRIRTASEARMMRSASSRHLKRLGLAVAVVFLTLGIVYLRINAVKTDELIQSLATSDARGFADAIDRLKPLRQWAASPLAAKAASIESQFPSAKSDAPNLRLLTGASIVLDSDEYAESIALSILSVDTSTALAAIAALAGEGHLATVWKHLERVHADPYASAEQQLRTAAAIAQMPENADRAVPRLPNGVAELLLRTIAHSPATIQDWTAAFRPASAQITPLLQAHLLDEDLDSKQRTIAARIVSQYRQDDIDELLSMALKAGPDQLDVLLRALAGRHANSRRRLEQIASSPIPTDGDELMKDQVSRQQANAIVLLRALGDTSRLFPALQHKPDPRLRAFLIDHFQQCPVQGNEWIRRLPTESDVGIKQALLMLAGRQEMLGDRDTAIKAILQIYADDPDSGVHSAAAWALRQLDCEQQLHLATQELTSLGLRPGFRWYVAPNGMTMIVVDAPGKVTLGSPDSEPGRDASDEQPHDFEINWSFAISATEVSQADFIALCTKDAQLKSDSAPLPDCPAHSVLWSEAIRYCRLLSEAHGIPEDEMVAPAGSPMKPGKFEDFRTRTGYRLPIDAEWEYVCRAGTKTARPFGFAPQLLPRYCCFAKNSAGQTMPVGSLLPNQFGAFDMLGNVAEWCLNSDQKPTDVLRPPAYSPLGRYIVRGNEFQSHGPLLRSANRRSDAEITRRVANGFRVARTLQPGAPVTLPHPQTD